ncbi:MAG: hypothetical protein LBP32_02180, partial [Spirochaetaceae bacterium]|nr:hypothetical protein [Spirochaetaceae bacterium]
MASEKDPSIYNDRGTIGSSDELDEYGVWVKSEPQDLSSAAAENQEISDSTLPELGDLPDFGPETGDTDYDSFSFEDESGEAAGFGGDDLEIPELGMTESGDSPGGGPLPDAVDEDGFTEVSMDDFLGDDMSSLDPGDASPMETLRDTNFDTEFDDTDTIANMKEETDMPDFDDVAAVSQDLRNSGSEKTGSAAPDLSTQLLMKIAEELASIKNELSSLKTELSGVRGGSAPEREPAEESGGGFFDEEDDEKIALTGDELDNILNTADFTEEAGSDATEEFSGGFGAPEEEAGFTVPPPPAESPAPLLDTPNIIDESPEPFSDTPDAMDDGEFSFNEPDLDEIGGEYEVNEVSAGTFEGEDFEIPMDGGPGEEPAGESPDASGEASALPESDTVFDDEIAIKLSGDDFSGASPEEAAEDAEEKDAEELRRLRQEGARPLTPAPDDTSYLDEDPLAFDEESLDLSNAVIDEPDLSGEITENPIEEPVIDDIALDLDFEDIDVSGPPGEETAANPVEGIVFEEETELEFPGESQEMVFDDSLDMPSGEDAGSGPGEENVSQVIPDGFEVEAGELQAEPSPGEDLVSEEAVQPGPAGEAGPREADSSNLPVNLKQELKTVLSYMDQLLESLPEDKIEEF